jgi:L,D-transpeptidase-like protein
MSPTVAVARRWVWRTSVAAAALTAVVPATMAAASADAAALAPSIKVTSPHCADPTRSNGTIAVTVTDNNPSASQDTYHVHAVPKAGGAWTSTPMTLHGGETKTATLHVASGAYEVRVREHGAGPTRSISVAECIVKDLRAAIAKRMTDGFHASITLDNTRSSAKTHATITDAGATTHLAIAPGATKHISYKVPKGHHTLKIYSGRTANPKHLLAKRRLLGSRILREGMQGQRVKDLQEYLDNSKRRDFFRHPAGGYSGQFSHLTTRSLERWQHATHHPVTGQVKVQGAQWKQLQREATKSRMPPGIDKRAVKAAIADGWAVDASKKYARVRVLHYQASTHQVLVTLSIRASYGDARGPQYVTAEGVWHIYRKEGADYTSTEYDGAPMPWATFFHGGQAMHEDPLTTSHGCIHIPSYTAAKYIHDLPYGTAVVVHQ